MSGSHLCNLDLAQLKTELRNAYAKKVLECQIKEKESEKEIAKIRQDFVSNLDKMKIREFNEESKRRETELTRKREVYKKELENQIKEKEGEKKVEEEEARKERKKLEQADRISEEREFIKKFKEKKELAERLNRERTIFEEIKKIRLRKEAEAEEKATEGNAKYLEEMDKRSLELRNLREEQKKRREELINKVAKMLVNFSDKKIERQSEIADLISEEIAWDIVIQEREDELRRKKMREELVQELKEQIIFTTECARRSLERDATFAQTVMKRIMEDEQMEKLTNQAKMRSKILYREDLLKMMEERRRIRDLEIARINKELEREKELEEIRKQEIREARKKLLVEHAANVAPYVKDNLLTHEEQVIIRSKRHAEKNS